MRGLAGKKALLVSWTLIASLIMPSGHVWASEAASAAAGQVVVDTREMELAPGAVYRWLDMKLDRGAEKVHMVEFDPKNASLELQPAKTFGKVYGMQPLTKMAAEADRQGNRVIAGINADFYDLANGVQHGLFMGEGTILSSPTSGRYAYGITADGASLFGPSPKLTKTVTIGGKTENLTHINRLRGAEELVLYSADFHTSTKTNELGDEVVLDIVEGEVKSGQTQRLKVAEILQNHGDTPLKTGQVVLSASGKYREALKPLQIGDEVTARYELESPWDQVKTAIGGAGMLVKDGVVQTNVGPEGVHPRTAIGAKADGSVVLFEVDGRAPGFSEGVETAELAAMMREQGVVNAMNLDGGGSSTFIARLPGESTFKMLNRGSDGGERSTANGVLLVNKAPAGPAEKLVVRPNLERVLTGSSISLRAAAVDAAGHPASFDGALVWQLDAALGQVDAQGKLTAGMSAGVGELTVTAGHLTGKAQVEVVDELTELRFPDAVKTIASGQSTIMEVTALRRGQVVQADNARLAWRVEGPIGTIDGSGTFTATTETEKSGKIFVRYGDVETSMEVNVGLPPVILEDFEGGLDRYLASAGDRVVLSKVSVETDEEFVRFGKQALKLEYDFTGQPSTSGAYLKTKTLGDAIVLPGYPEKISMWVYGDGRKHWLRAQLRDKKGVIPLDFVDQTTGIDFVGWKYLEAVVPKGRELPLTMDMPVRYMETSAAKKDAGVLYVDQISALYGPAKDDMKPPVLKIVSPAEGATVRTNTPVIQAIGEDDGYDPATHPGTTLIDPEQIRVHLDGVPVQHALYPPKGEITYKPGVPLADGVHQAKVRIKDMSGNVTTREWTFHVDTGSSKLVYDTPQRMYAGGTYTLDVKGFKAAGIRGAQLELGFDPAKVEVLEAVKGSKLQDSQWQPITDAAKGIVRLAWTGLDASGLTDADLLGQIRYRIKQDAVGAHQIAFRSGAISFTHTGDMSFPFFGLPLNADIAYGLQLGWDEDGRAQGYPTALRVSDEGGRPVEGARIVADGADLGVTGADGQLVTSSLTASVKEYKLQASKDGGFSPVMVFKVSPLAGSSVPNNIAVQMGADPARSRSFNWHTHPGTDQTVVEIVKQSEFAGFDQANVRKYTGDSKLYNTYDLGTVRVHRAAATDLEPGERYVYRVGDGAGNDSPQGMFQTAPISAPVSAPAPGTGEEDSLKFLYFADSQASDLNGYKLWGNTVKKAAAEHPDAEFMLHAGDMVDSGYKENEWNMWFGQAQEQLLQTTLVAVIGNHEYSTASGNSDFQAHFNQPGNGLPSLQGTSFSFDYKDMHFVVLNSEQDYEQQAAWLREDLAATDKTWKVVAFHRGPYGSIYDTEVVRQHWVPVLDEFGVDLVLNGHDHIYLRTVPLRGGQEVPAGQGTTYAIAGSTGPKFYSYTERSWPLAKLDEEQTQMYAAIEMKGGSLSYVAKTVEGRVVDEFTLVKQRPQLPETVLLDREAVSLAVGESLKLQATVLPENASNKQVTWSVYDSAPGAIVSVSEDGRVLAHAEGRATVRATAVASGVYADSAITVLPFSEGTKLELLGKGELVAGGQDMAVAEAVYEGKRTRLTEGVVFASSVPAVAVVDGQGVVTALSPGETVISAVYASLRADYRLTVIAKEPEPENKLERIELSGLPGTLEVGKSAQASVTGVYADGSRAGLSEGVVFDSSSMTVASVSLTGKVTALTEGISVIRAVYEGLSSPFTVKVVRASDSGSDPEPGTGGSAPFAPAPDRTESQPGPVELTAEQLSSMMTDRGVEIRLSGSFEGLTLPGTAADMLEGKPVQITADGLSMTLPAEVLLAVSKLLPAGQDADSRIQLEAAGVAGDAVRKLLAQAEQMSEAELKAAGEVLEFRLSIMTKDGRTASLTRFEQPIRLTLKADSGTDRKLAGIYFIADNGKLEYVGGTWKDGGLTADISHFSKYAVLEYRKTFADLASDHWAFPVMRELAAQHLVDGVGGAAFAPEQQVTRAQFAAMLVRLLGLEGGSAASFADVADDAWYAAEVGAAAQAGLVEGIGGGQFAPDAAVKRQEMAAMLVRAYVLQTGKQPEKQPAVAAGFVDLEAAPGWAKQAVADAYGLDLVSGRAAEQFHPLDAVTRAESAQAVYNLKARLSR
ncbi:S-layer homology domain-containing protein [Paenibacillus sp. UNCCL117]|uniref:phosphodiester glycosidase family protein n=1 Tax=unclassified Paenibacillus TaxID=185978 RepID=UPI0008917F91|nr:MULTISPECIES: phosphodiester glycosidase family protein [unclassified Paenibacillus]SDE23954.1 S-layer homology domain-containing protein [Paenibacillus sp. cl123]SFW42451.1 S-layer homology domain-containing protein [Paenibacillus sp. UNCCL117]